MKLRFCFQNGAFPQVAFHPKSDFKSVLPRLREEKRFLAVERQQGFDPVPDFLEQCSFLASEIEKAHKVVKKVSMLK